jgi:hydroxyacyl-ACP dehydratase HTD2-like protein with hotdog domain
MRGIPASDLPFDLPLVLPQLRLSPTAMQIFMFSAVTWNRHHIHYNPDAARAEGHPDVVVQRSLIGNYFARHAGAWLGAAGRVARLSWRVTGLAVPNEGLCCHGVVRERLDASFRPDDGAPASVPLRYQGWLTAEDGREVASAEGVLCIHAIS